MVPWNPSNAAPIELGSDTLADVSMVFLDSFTQLIEPDDKRCLIRIEALDRLRWNLLAPPSTVEVVDYNEADEPCWKPLLSPKHPLADEAVTRIPRSRMRVVLNMIEYWECWFDMDMMDDIPPPLLIENSDGRAITVEQFIVEVSKYAESLRDTIYEIEDRGPWQKEDARVYYFLITGPKCREAGDPDVVFAIHDISDITNSVRDFEDEWVRKERGVCRKLPAPVV